MFHLKISNKFGVKEIDQVIGPIDMGRGGAESDSRIIIRGDMSVSRDHLRIEESSPGKIRARNLSTSKVIDVLDQQGLESGQTRVFDLPVRFMVGESLVQISVAAPTKAAEDAFLKSISRSPLVGRLAPEHPTLLELGVAPTSEKLARWFETVIAVQRAAAGSTEFYQQTAQALVNLVGLDYGFVLLRKDSQWQVAASAAKSGEVKSSFSTTILRQVVQEGCTFYQELDEEQTSRSLREVRSAVAAPIFNTAEEVAGVLYGIRTKLVEGRGASIGSLEAQVVQLLASAVGVGMARAEQEAKASRLQVQFEQFFSADLARELQNNPQLLDGQKRTITVMFSDIRGFSRTAEKIGPEQTCRLVSDVMERLTLRIREFEGVVVDYMGDGLMAMWNAPVEQPDHAERACRAALAMQAEMPSVSRDWQSIVGQPLKIGIGVNTGPALVGNTGSRLKFKYGPLGHAVNLASRVEGATKHFGIPILITGSTHALLKKRFATRRLCQVRVVGVGEAVNLYELHAETAEPAWRTRRDAYENALTLYEAGQWAASCRAIYPLLGDQAGQYDIPSLNLLTRAIENMKSPPEEFDPVVEMSSK
ncbi:MAG: adenylate/guanylate cyclase domain-containing protein [Gemmataceae bacterium]